MNTSVTNIACRHRGNLLLAGTIALTLTSGYARANSTQPTRHTEKSDTTRVHNITSTKSTTLANAVSAVSVSEPSTATSMYHLYVSPSGEDSNRGTPDAPFRTIGKATSVARASTTIHVAAGNYFGNITSANSGVHLGRIRYISDIKWGAKIIGAGHEAHWTNNGNFVDISGFDISGPGRIGILNNGSNTLIVGNHVHDIKVGNGCSGNGGAGIVNANYSAADNDVIGNVVNDIGVRGQCNGIQGIYHSNLRGTIVNNLVYRVSAWGIHLWHAANNVVVANNTVLSNGSSGMGGGIEMGAGDSPRGIVLDNTMIINNIVYNNPGASITQYCYPGVRCIGSSNVISNNLVYANGSPISMKVGSATGTISADPRFVDGDPGGSGNYHLRSDSPAIDQASAASAPTTDIDGIARPLGGATDLGAFESF